MVWTVPGRRMKAKRAHRIPLCGRAVEILRRSGFTWLGNETGDEELVFPTVRGKAPAPRPSRSWSETWASRRCRTAFALVPRQAAERTDHPREVVEAALAHVVGNRTEAAYARSDLFERRRHLMSDWAAYLDGGRGRLVPLRR